MSKPRNIATKTIRKPRLKAGGLSIMAHETKGKITGFTVKLDETETLFEVRNNKILDAFIKAQKHAATLI